MTESAPPKQAQGSSPSAFLPTLAGVNQSSLLSGPFGVNNAQQQQQQHHHQQQQQLMQNALLGNRGQTERLFQTGGNGKITSSALGANKCDWSELRKNIKFADSC